MTEPATEAPIRRHPFARWRRWLPRAVFESVLIVFSVILALALTNWAEERRTAHRVAEMRAFLIQEITANRAELGSDYYIPHHRQLKRAFAQAGGMPDATEVTRKTAEPAIQALFGGSGLHLAAPRDAVWTSVSANDLFEHMDAEEVFILAQVYRAQESLESINRAGYDNAVGLLDILTDEGDAHRQMLRMTLYLEDLIQQETNLVRLYDQALVRLGAPIPVSPPARRPATTAKDDGAAPKG